jgi:hypothetical protein
MAHFYGGAMPAHRFRSSPRKRRKLMWLYLARKM